MFINVTMTARKVPSFKNKKNNLLNKRSYRNNMINNYPLIFDEVMIKQLKKVAKNQSVKEILIKMLDKIEERGPDAGELLDSRLFIYEVKNKHPPIRLYFKHNVNSNEIYIFEFEMKTSKKKQQKTIEKIRKKVLES